MYKEFDFSPSDYDEETTQIYYELENRQQMLTDEISKTALWGVFNLIALRKRLNQVEQDMHDLSGIMGLKMRV
jgi:hypothetical protein